MTPCSDFFIALIKNNIGHEVIKGIMVYISTPPAEISLDKKNSKGILFVCWVAILRNPASPDYGLQRRCTWVFVGAG